MEWVKYFEKVPEFLKKYRYALAVVLAGILLMTLPEKRPKPAPTALPAASCRDTEQALEEILGRIRGCGNVSVLLTEASGMETVYQTDTDENAHSDGKNIRNQTILIRDSRTGDRGLIRKQLPPRWRGAVIVCEGADLPAVRLAVSEAVSCATGLGADQISVLKMK